MHIFCLLHMDNLHVHSQIFMAHFFGNTYYSWRAYQVHICSPRCGWLARTLHAWSIHERIHLCGEVQSGRIVPSPTRRSQSPSCRNWRRIERKGAQTAYSIHFPWHNIHCLLIEWLVARVPILVQSSSPKEDHVREVKHINCFTLQGCLLHAPQSITLVLIKNRHRWGAYCPTIDTRYHWECAWGRIGYKVKF